MTVYPSRLNNRSCKNILSPFRAAVFGLLCIAGSNSATAVSLVDYVGAETSNDGIPSDWGTTTSTGYKSGFRSTGTDAKAFSVTGTNAYGTDGYLFFATENQTQFNSGHLNGTVSTASSVTDAEGNSPAFNGVTSYTSNITIGLPGDHNVAWATARAGFGKMSDPTLAIGTSVPVIDYGLYGAFEQGDTTNAVYDVLSFTLSSDASFRLGVMTGSGDLQKPLGMSLVGDNTDSATMSGQNNYNRPDWYFFDVEGDSGDTFTLQLTQNGSNNQTAISGLVFDSAAVPEPSAVVLALGAGLLLVGSRARRSQVQI